MQLSMVIIMTKKKIHPYSSSPLLILNRWLEKQTEEKYLRLNDDDVLFRTLLIKLMEARIDKCEENERNNRIKELADSLL